MSPMENNNDGTKSFDEMLEEAQKNQINRIDFRPEAIDLKLEESEHRFDAAVQDAAKRYGLSAEKIDNSVPIGTMVEEEKYKDMTVEEYRKKQIDGLDKATKEFLAGKNIKIEDLYNNPNIPVENLNGMSLAIQKWKDNPADFDKKFKNLQLASTKNYSDVFSRIEGKLGTDFRKNNPDLFEVGFVGLGKIKDKDYTEAGLKKMVEEASAGKNVTATEQYYIVKALMNAHGVDRTEPKPEPKSVPVVASTLTYVSSSSGEDSDNFSGFGGGDGDFIGSNPETGVKEKTQLQIAQEAQKEAEIAAKNAEALKQKALKTGNEVMAGTGDSKKAQEAQKAYEAAQKKAEELKQKAIKEGNKVMQ